MAAESGGQSERDPFEAFIDEIFEEMVRDSGFLHTGTGFRHGKDPLAGPLMEAAVASLSRPPSRSSELERVLFAQTLARDVMTPWPLVLHANHTADQAAAIFRRTGLQALPVVDAGGNFVGLLRDDGPRAEPSADGRPARPISDVMATDMAACEEDSRFSELIRLLEREVREALGFQLEREILLVGQWQE